MKILKSSIYIPNSDKKPKKTKQNKTARPMTPTTLPVDVTVHWALAVCFAISSNSDFYSGQWYSLYYRYNLKLCGVSP